MTTRHDVARRAGVSPRTVSNVVSGGVRVAEATRARVLEAIAELDYRPSEIGRMLRTGRTGMIALVVPEFDTPYATELARLLTDHARRRGYTLMIEQTDGVRERELELLARADRKSVFDGFVVGALSLTDDDLSRSGRSERPVVLLGEEVRAGFDHVRIDNHGAARDATRHLVARGCRRIVAVGAQHSGRRSSIGRLSGFEEAIAEAAPAVHGEPAYIETHSRQAGYEVTRALLSGSRPPDGLFCFSDRLAAGALRALGEAGARVPDAVAVVGFDDSDEGRFLTPSLTTIAPDKDAIARSAIDLLVARIEGDQGPPQQLVTTHRLVRRESA